MVEGKTVRTPKGVFLFFYGGWGYTPTNIKEWQWKFY